MASRHHARSKSDDPSATTSGPSSSSRLPFPHSPPTSPTSSMAFVGHSASLLQPPPHPHSPPASSRHDVFVTTLSRYPPPESDSMSHVQFSIGGGRDRGGLGGGGGGNGMSSEEARWIEANVQRDRLRRWGTWQKCLGAVAALWATYTATRYFVAFVLYADDHDRQVYALTLGTLSACTVLIYAANAMYAWFGYSPRNLMGVFRVSTLVAALTLLAPAVINVVLTCIWATASSDGSPHDVLGRCNWDLDVVWTGTSGECSASGHSPISFTAWLVGAVIRLAVTLLILGGYQYTSHVCFQLSGGFCPLVALAHRSRSHSIVPLVGAAASHHRDSESTNQQHHPNTSVDTVRPLPAPLSPPLLPPPLPASSSSSSAKSSPSKREPRVLLRHDRPPGLGPLTNAQLSSDQPPVMATTSAVTTPPGPLITPPISRYIPSLGAGPRYPDPDFGSDSSNPSSPAEIYYTPSGAYGGRYSSSNPNSSNPTPTPPATTTRTSSRRSTATSSTAASGSGSGGHHYYSQPNPNGASYFPPQPLPHPQSPQSQSPRSQSPRSQSPTRAQMQEYQFPNPAMMTTSAASSPLSPSTPGPSADYAMLQSWATDFRSMIDRVNRETEEGLEMARETGQYASSSSGYYGGGGNGRSNGYGNVSQSGPSSVMVLGGVVRRMETIESFGSKEVQSIMGNSRPPTAMGIGRPNRTSRGGLSIDSTGTLGRVIGDKEKESP